MTLDSSERLSLKRDVQTSDRPKPELASPDRLTQAAIRGLESLEKKFWGHTDRLYEATDTSKYKGLL